MITPAMVLEWLDQVLTENPDLTPEVAKLVVAHQRGKKFVIPKDLDAKFEATGRHGPQAR